jgi:hypothetical protein
MSESFRFDLERLDRMLQQLEKQRSHTALANDIYEAGAYWSKLGHRALQNDTRVNYPARAQEEFLLLEKLQSPLENQREEGLFREALAKGRSILLALQTIKPPQGGHLGSLRSIYKEFRFLEFAYSFRITHEEPIGVMFSSGEVYINLQWATTPYLSCEFGPEGSPKKSFAIDDLLYMVHDSRYRTLPRELSLDTEAKVMEWFEFLASVFKEYGKAVLMNEAGIFEELEKAQMHRDREYTHDMDARYGSFL